METALRIVDYVGSLNRYQLAAAVVFIGTPAGLLMLWFAQALVSRGNGCTDEEGDL